MAACLDGFKAQLVRKVASKSLTNSEAPIRSQRALQGKNQNVVGANPAIGNKNHFNSVYPELSPLCVNLFLKNHTAFIKKYFNISKKHIDSVYSKTPLEDILVEKASILL